MTRHISKPDGTLRARDGRQIGYGEFGDPDGKPVILFHGYGDSRLTRHPDDELTARLGVRLITVDRPGIGLTDPMKEHTIIDRLHDIEAVSEALKIDRFAVLGWSGGAPFALAAAHEFGQYVTRAGIAGGFGPFERTGFRNLAPKEIRRVIVILKAAPWMSGMLAKESAKQLQAGGHSAMANGDGLASSSDSGLLANPQIRDNVTRGAEEAFRQGHEGVAADMLLVFRFKWGFKPEDVSRPVDLWYGEEDRMTPVEVGRGLASLLPDARLRVSPGAGHLLHLRYWEEILQTLIEARPAEVRVAAPWVEPIVVAPAAAAAEVSTPAATAEPVAAEAAPAAAEHAEAEPSEAQAVPVAAAAASVADASPAVETEEREPVSAASAAPVRREVDLPQRDVAAFVVTPRAPVSSVDERARLRAAGFLIDDEPEAEPEAVAAEPEAVAAEPEAEAVAAEPEAVAVEPEAVEADRKPSRPSRKRSPSSRKPSRRSRKPLPSEPEAAAAEPEAVAVEPAAAEPEAVPVEPAAAAEAPHLEPAAAAPAAGEITAEPEAPAEPEVQPEPAEPMSTAPPPSPKSAEFERLSAAGFLVDDAAAAYLAAALGGLAPDQPAASADAAETASAGDETGPPPAEVAISEASATQPEAAGEEPAEAASAVTAEATGVPTHSGTLDAAERLRAAGYAIEDVEVHVEQPEAIYALLRDHEAEQPPAEPEPAPESQAPPDADVTAAAVEAEVVTSDAIEAAEPQPAQEEGALASTSAGLTPGEPRDEDEDERLRAAGFSAAIEDSAEPTVSSEVDAGDAPVPGDGKAPEAAFAGEVTDDQRRADELADRLEAFADRYTGGPQDSDADAIDSEAEMSDAAAAADAAVDVDVEEAPAAQAGAGEPAAESAGGSELIEEAIESTPVAAGHAELNGAASEAAVAGDEPSGDASPEPDPLLERLRAAGFAVLEPVAPGGR